MNLSPKRTQVIYASPMQSTDRMRPFGRLLTAMVTPFDADLELDPDKAAELATHLVDDLGHDGLVINGTTGEAPTTTDEEKATLLRAVVEAVGDRAHVVAGVGTFATAHTVELARQAADAGADGLLVVTPYYSRPPQRGLLHHFCTVADATELPVLLYDIPHRSGIPIEEATLVELAGHDRIVGVKDAKCDATSSARVMAAVAERGHDLAFYAGDDNYALPLLAVGGVGLIGTSTHFSGAIAKQMIEAYEAGDPAGALAHYRQVAPVFTGVFATQGCILVKAGLTLQGRSVGGLRPPLPEATPEETAAFEQCLAASGLR